MTHNPLSPTNPFARVLDALDEQRTEIELFRNSLTELSTEVDKLSTSLLRYEDNLETAAVKTDALQSETKKTVRILNRF